MSETVLTLQTLNLRSVEFMLIDAALLTCEGNKKAAAKALGISRSALYAKLKRHGLASTAPAPEGS